MDYLVMDVYWLGVCVKTNIIHLKLESNASVH